jgi:hypothetical protein
VGQLGFFDLNRRYEGLDEKSDPLVAVAATVPSASSGFEYCSCLHIVAGRLAGRTNTPTVRPGAKVGRSPVSIALISRKQLYWNAYILRAALF